MTYIGVRRCSVGQSLRNQLSRFHAKTYVPRVSVRGVLVPLNHEFKTASEAKAYAERFAAKWNRFEDRRLAAAMERKMKDELSKSVPIGAGDHGSGDGGGGAAALVVP